MLVITVFALTTHRFCFVIACSSCTIVTCDTNYILKLTSCSFPHIHQAHHAAHRSSLVLETGFPLGHRCGGARRPGLRCVGARRPALYGDWLPGRSQPSPPVESPSAPLSTGRTLSRIVVDYHQEGKTNSPVSRGLIPIWCDAGRYLQFVGLDHVLS
jgi:hypothetical protein